MKSNYDNNIKYSLLNWNMITSSYKVAFGGKNMPQGSSHFKTVSGYDSTHVASADINDLES